MIKYTLKVINSGTSATSFAIFQKCPTGNSIYTLAWMSKYAAQGVTNTFEWNVKYDVVWSQPGKNLVAGTICNTASAIGDLYHQGAVTASESRAVNLSSRNTSTVLNYDETHNAYSFGEMTQTAEDNEIVIRTSTEVPDFNVASTSAVVGVGIGMSGYGLFLVGGEPNKLTKWDISEPKYYLISGNFKTGEIIDVGSVMGNALEVPFYGGYNRSAKLNKENVLELSD